jgi:hypothetical protein
VSFELPPEKGAGRYFKGAIDRIELGIELPAQTADYRDDRKRGNTITHLRLYKFLGYNPNHNAVWPAFTFALSASAVGAGLPANRSPAGCDPAGQNHVLFELPPEKGGWLSLQ